MPPPPEPFVALPLPPPHIRMNSAAEREDDRYRRAARLVASAVTDLLGLERFSTGRDLPPPIQDCRVLDYGCGTARLLTGFELLDSVPRHYHGLDVQEHLVDWCRSALHRPGAIEFDLVDMHNGRYNTSGSFQPDRVIPDRVGEVDLVVVRSVFTHMTVADIQTCLREFRRVLADDGRVYATVNVRHGVPTWVDNPGNPDAPTLRRVELDKTFFELLVEDAGFRSAAFVESVENQCVYLLRPA